MNAQSPAEWALEARHIQQLIKQDRARLSEIEASRPSFLGKRGGALAAINKDGAVEITGYYGQDEIRALMAYLQSCIIPEE